MFLFFNKTRDVVMNNRREHTVCGLKVNSLVERAHAFQTKRLLDCTQSNPPS
jgi:hypothetical protein